MYLKTFRSLSVRDALRSVRQELGPDALILSTSLVPTRGWRGWLGGREVEVTAGAEREPSDPRPAQSEGRQHGRASQSAELAARLRAVGLDHGLADEVATSIPASSRRGASFHTLSGALADRLAELAAVDDDYAPVEVFVGPPGAGKTTTIAKIASQERACHGRRLGLIAADGYRIGAVEQLRTYAEIIGVPFRIARTAADLDRALTGEHRQPLLVDTAGRSPTDEAARELFRVLASLRHVRTHLVIPAAMSVSAIRRVFEAYGDAQPTRLVLTRLDEAESLSPLVGLLRERQLPISYLGTGQRVPEDLKRATAQLLAASVLGEATPGTAMTT